MAAASPVSPRGASRRFDEIAEELALAVAASPDASEAAAELRRLAEEIEALTADDPFPAGVASALRMTDGSGSMAASLTELAAALLHDHAGESGGRSREDLRVFLEGLGHGRGDFLRRVADFVESRHGR